MDDRHGVTVRTLTAPDRVHVLALTRKCLDPRDTDDAEGLERFLRHGDRVGVVAERDGRLVGLAVGRVGDRAGEDRPAYVLLLAVAEPERRAGVGALLLRRLEQRCIERGATSIQTDGGPPAYWWPGVDRTYADAIAFFGARGYEVAREAANMSVDLAGRRALVTRPAPEGLGVRRLEASEWPGFGRWMEATWGTAWAEEVRGSLSRRPTSCFVVAADADHLGSAGYLGFAAYDTNRRGWFGPMGSTPGARGRGVGTALLRACLSDYLVQGRESCEIAWVGPVEFYERAVGARVDRRFVQLRKTLGGDGPVGPSA